MSWSLLTSSDNPGKTFSRPLGLNETSYYYDRLFNGTTDIIWRYVVQHSDPATWALFFNEENVKRAWATLKQWYPLLGARVDDSNGADAARFVVSEYSLTHHHPDEVTFTPVSSRSEVEAAILSLMRANPMSDHHLIARVLIFPHTHTPGTYEILFRCSHCMADGISGTTVARTFFDVLVSPSATIPPLEERLAMALSSDQLNPTNNMTLPRQRWRRAIAQVTFLNRRRKFAGGHTLPRTVTETTYRTPAVTDRVTRQFSFTETVAILDGCRQQQLTFGAAIPVISQLALTRILHRRYLRGEISEEEWERRRRQPMHFMGPTNLRPYMDPVWRRKGGATEVALMIDFYECTLPFMPTPFGTRKDEGVPRVNGAPPYSTLMSHARFFHRVRIFKAQLQKQAMHPLMLDIAAARQPSYILGKQIAVTHWAAAKKGEPLPKYTLPPHWDSLPSDFVSSGSHSSIGQLSLLIPERYPLLPGHPLSVRTTRAAGSQYGEAIAQTSTAQAPTVSLEVDSHANALLHITDHQTYVHARPMMLVIGNGTERGRLGMIAMFDANVYAKADLEELLDECRDAALFYLAGDKTVKSKL